MSSLWALLALFLLHILHTDAQSPVEDPVEDQVCFADDDGAKTCSTSQDAAKITANDSAVPVDVATYDCGGTPGWRRVGYLDMTDSSQSCPSGLAFKNYTADLRSCGRASDEAGCWSTFYNTGGSQYSRVCGRVRGYQFGATSAFYEYHYNKDSFDSYYVEGVSLTHGASGNRTHIWTFAACVSEVYSDMFPTLSCPCVTEKAPQPPDFVGDDYFCESGLNTKWSLNNYDFYPKDPLWDGENCVSSCCEFNNPPFFTKALPSPTSDDIELRLCSHNLAVNVDIPIDQVELYVQ